MQVTDETSILDESFGHLLPLAGVPPQIAQQLQTLISQAIAPLLERISDLEATNAALVDRLAVLEGLSAPPMDATTSPPLCLTPTGPTSAGERAPGRDFTASG